MLNEVKKIIGPKKDGITGIGINQRSGILLG